MISTTLTTFNRLEYTKQTIESYVKTTKTPHELIVVDNNSTDGTQKYLKGLKKKGVINELILNEENKFPAYSTNQGWDLSSPEATLLHRSDNDLIYEKGWDKEVIQAFKDIPNLGQLGLINELYQLKPSLHEDYLNKVGITIEEHGKTKVMLPPNAQNTTGGPCVVPAVIWRGGLSWPEDEWQGSYNEDAKYSDLIREAGYLVYELVQDNVRHIGYGDIRKYMKYYIETFARRGYHNFFVERLDREVKGQIKDSKVID
jgi:glycosyltransferase involved in cell wall biosynthesis